MHQRAQMVLQEKQQFVVLYSNVSYHSGPSANLIHLAEEVMIVRQHTLDQLQRESLPERIEFQETRMLRVCK